MMSVRAKLHDVIAVLYVLRSLSDVSQKLLKRLSDAFDLSDAPQTLFQQVS